MGEKIKYAQMHDLLYEQIKGLIRAEERLDYSLDKARLIDFGKKEFSDEEFEVMEALCSRFARLADILIQKILRLIDKIELEDADLSVIDRIEKAEKRGIISSACEFKNIRALRNEIAHEYAEERFCDICRDVAGYIPALKDAVCRVKDYAENLRERSFKSDKISGH